MMISQEQVEQAKRLLGVNKGLALDIDNTLSYTTSSVFALLEGYPRSAENAAHSIDEMIGKYGHSDKVPEWNTPEVRLVTETALRDPAFYRYLDIIDGAQEHAWNLSRLTWLSAYITARPHAVRDASAAWLRDDFPVLPLITKPNGLTSLDNNAWKASLLSSLYPQVSGIVDDDQGLLEELGPSYPGVVLLFGKETLPSNSPPHAYACKEWRDVYTQAECLAQEGILPSYNGRLVR